ncbi:ComF family protein [Stenotrophomonas tumulicola]|uniref:ComF family protein n=1 Tax=Stenotrophomonas tumulicola TaxID=1685415 RepID=A0A7W3FMD2_9GAMM|nr:ComF family protein [Stenotrophomonas tumulicola]MBA8682226.1 ComF family protein [Stenotrophomonas tumulicola]
MRLPLLRAPGSRLLGILLPPVCQVCGEPGEHDRELCGPCCLALPWHTDGCARCAAPLPEDASDICFRCEEMPPLLDHCWASLRYEDPVSALLLRYKFHQDLAAGRLLAQLMALSPPPWPLPPLVAVPLHGSRLRRRGYDQAGELARLIGAPRWHGLRRIRATLPQSERGADARRHNLDGAFAVRGPVPDAVVLVDDVMTTGSTLHACAEALRAAGCRDVSAWVCARVP